MSSILFRDSGRSPATLQHLKPISLELGGKSPNIVFADANLEDAVNMSAFGIYFAQEVAKAVDSGKGVLFLIVNYAGDVLNFEMAAELAEMDGIATKTVRIYDDVASAPAERMEERRGIAGALFVYKMAGAAASRGCSLDEVARIAQKANASMRSIGVALTSGSIPGAEKPVFSLAEDEIEFGMGIHGEPGVKRTKMMKADELTESMMSYLLVDLPVRKGDEVCVLINGLGSTTLMELMIVNRKVSQILRKLEIAIYGTAVNSFCTTQEMGGVSITLMRMDDELKTYYDHPAHSPYYTKRAKQEW